MDDPEIATFDELNLLDDEDLVALRLRYIDQIGCGRRSNRYQNAVGAINGILKMRRTPTRVDNDRQVGELYRAAGALIDDDSDENWARLEAAHAAMAKPGKDRDG